MGKASADWFWKDDFGAVSMGETSYVRVCVGGKFIDLQSSLAQVEFNATGQDMTQERHAWGRMCEPTH